jgi:uncharacterized membrane-anchored protein YjiN (DUF445 family)
VVSVLGWVGTFFLPEVGWVTVLRHACEGGFVGGICDAFAIGKVYSKVEANFEELTGAVSSTVIDDMIKPEEIVDQLQEHLRQPEVARDLLEKVEKRAPSQEVVRRYLGDIWHDTLRDRCIEWLVHLDASATLGRIAEQSEQATLHKDAILRSGVYLCLKHAASGPALAERLYEGIIEEYGQVCVYELPRLPLLPGNPPSVKLESVLRFALTPERLQQRLVEAAEGLLDPRGEGGRDSPLREVGLDYLRRYNDGWTELPEEQRKYFADRLLQQVVPPLLDSIADELWAHRDELHRLVQTEQALTSHPVIDLISTEVGQLVQTKLSGLDRDLTGLLTQKLRSQGKEGFRTMLEARTRPQLDWIQVNGATLGLVLGAVAGLVTVWMHALGPTPVP